MRVLCIKPTRYFLEFMKEYTVAGEFPSPCSHGDPTYAIAEFPRPSNIRAARCPACKAVVGGQMKQPYMIFMQKRFIPIVDPDPKQAIREKEKEIS